MPSLKVIFTCLLVIGLLPFLDAQFIMQDTTVTECEGTLTDSDQGPLPGQYDHNEDYTFTICVDGAGSITAIFNFFATEDVFDVLTIYDGPDTSSPVLDVLTGVVSNPPILVANSGCMTFHFISDDNIVGTGWLLEWSVEVEDMVDPDIDILSNLDCPLGTLDFSIDPRIPCDIISPENFQLIGPDGAGIAGATALDCDADNTASIVSLTFSDSLSISGNYSIIFNGYIVNTCNDTLYFESLIEFELTDCPFEVQIVLIEQACPENCGVLQVEIYSSDPGPFIINWSHTSENSEIIDICSDSIALIEVEVTNTANGSTADDNFAYTPLPSPIIFNPLLSDTICSSSASHLYEISNPGGFWNSNVMDNQTEDTYYRFYRWNWSTGIQQDFIEYTDPNGCVTHDTVYVIPITASLDQAVCLGQSELQLTGNNPSEGVWEGPNTTEDGIFTTTVEGTFNVSFTNSEGCSDWKTVTVIDNIEFQELDTICSNISIDLRHYVNSLGGVWTGPGITNWYVGRLEAWQANGNEWNTYYYEMEGCMDSIEIYVSQVWAGPDLAVCQETESIQLLFGGDWSGPGTYNQVDSTFDISNLSTGSYEFTRTQAGCEDRFTLTIQDVNLGIIDNNVFCYHTGMIPIRDIVESNPWDGTFSGEAVIDVAGEIYFDPSQATSNESFIYFSTLGCLDSVMIEIEQAVDLEDYSFCEAEGLQNLDNQGNIGYWQGTGILVPETGLLNPEELNIGDNEVYFISSLGCATPVNIEIIEFLTAEINNIEDNYCFQDSIISFDIAPLNGIFMINGEITTPDMNPADIGSGFHELEYIVGTGACEDKTSIFISISDEISGLTYALMDTLCPEETTTIFVDTEGGFENITATWNQGLGFGKSHTISPNQTTVYDVTLSDGCSDDVILPLNVYVIDTFNVGVNLGPEVCYGDSSYIELILDQPENYDITWDGKTSIDGHILKDFPGSFLVNLTEKASGCEQQYTIDIPGSSPLGADFNFIPNQDCIDIIDNKLTILNLAYGYTDGFMNFGITDDQIDINTGSLSQIYEDIGIFEITQIVFNELGCSDTLTREICVENRVRLFVPNVFTPNGDDVNDFLSIYGIGITNFSIQIYDRWGNQVFKTKDINESWDGKFNGTLVSQGVYAIAMQYENQETGKVYVEYFDVTVSR